MESEETNDHPTTTNFKKGTALYSYNTRLPDTIQVIAGDELHVFPQYTADDWLYVERIVV